MDKPVYYSIHVNYSAWKEFMGNNALTLRCSLGVYISPQKQALNNKATHYWFIRTRERSMVTDVVSELCLGTWGQKGNECIDDGQLNYTFPLYCTELDIFPLDTNHFQQKHQSIVTVFLAIAAQHLNP
jgi:hypothetical protein